MATTPAASASTCAAAAARPAKATALIRVEMHFLPDAYVTCDACRGMRYNRETLEIRYKGRNIHEVLEMTIEDAAVFFRSVPARAGQAADAARRRAVVRAARAERDDAVGWRGATHQARARTRQARDRPHALHPRRADDGPALPRHRAVARRAAAPARRRQHDRRDRAQPRRDQDRGLDRRHGTGRWRRRRHGRRRRHAGADVAQTPGSHTGQYLARVLARRAELCE